MFHRTLKKIILLVLVAVLMTACSSKTELPVAVLDTSEGKITFTLRSDIAPVTVENFTGLVYGTKEWSKLDSKESFNVPFYDGLKFYKVDRNRMIYSGDPQENGQGGPGFYYDDECYYDGVPIIGKITDLEVARRVLEEIILPYLKKSQFQDRDNELFQLFVKCSNQKTPRPIMQHPIEYYLEKAAYDKFFGTRGKLKAKVEYGSVCMANDGTNINGSRFFIVTAKEGLPEMDGHYTVFGKVKTGMDVVHKIESGITDLNGKLLKDVTINEVYVR